MGKLFTSWAVEPVKRSKFICIYGVLVYQLRKIHGTGAMAPLTHLESLKLKASTFFAK